MYLRSIPKIFLVVFILCTGFNVQSQDIYPEIENELDRNVRDFLEGHASSWRDMNVPLSDGRLLYDLIIQNKYTSAVEIGTSTGHSAIWIAWALSKTGGQLITIEIDKQRHREAKANFKKARLDKFIDARLGDAHELVPALEGTYDFVFSDADKYWYKNYFIAMEDKLKPGGCFTAHNTSMRMRGIQDFIEYVQSHKDFETTIDNSGPSGISISYKKR